ncbi:MAG TPA: DciA family protein [Beijerinckiaceae bacterium]|jgi:hypothetical protein
MARPRPLADLLDHCLKPALRAQGFAAADVLVAWPDIVGERLAAYTQPIKLEWRHRARDADPDARPEPASLVVRVEGAFAIELQHLAPIVIERVNAHYGWRCVGRLVLKQGPVRRPVKPSRALPSLAPEEQAKVEAAVSGVAETGLKAALDRLGRAVLADKPGNGP